MTEYKITLTFPGIELSGSHYDPGELSKDMQKLLKKFSPHNLPVGTNVTVTPLPKPLPELPAKLKEYCQSWSEDWAKDDCTQRAYALWNKHGNWELVLTELLKQDGEKLG